MASAPRSKTRLFRAPGRVNLIGEHTDYAGGYVLPVALDLACDVEATPCDAGVLRFRSLDLSQAVSIGIDELAAAVPRGDWSDYPIGVAGELMRRGVALQGASLSIRSRVPIGAGLSSSAALEVGVALALNTLSQGSLSRKDLAQVCRDAEAEFVGLQCGIMDQFASLFGSAGHAVLIDCRSLDHRLVSLPPNLEIVVVDTGVKHELASSEYNRRCQEVEAAESRIGRALRDVAVEELPGIEARLEAPLDRRARHIVTENARVLDFIAAAEQQQQLDRMGELMAASHRSLAVDYEVSCLELDFLVEAAGAFDSLVGSRMTGGGFGGCTINLVPKDQVTLFQQFILERFEQRFGETAASYVCAASDGAREVPNGSPESH